MLRVLLVDDDESLRQLLATQLKQDFGAVVDEAGSGNEAIELINFNKKYCLIISDFNMPNGNGKDLQDFLVVNDVESFFFFYTSEADIQANYLHENFVGVIQKPNIRHLFTELTLKICESNLKKNGLAF